MSPSISYLTPIYEIPNIARRQATYSNEITPLSCHRHVTSVTCALYKPQFATVRLFLHLKEKQTSSI